MCKDGICASSFYKEHKCPCRINMNVALWAQHYYLIYGSSLWRQQHFVIQTFLYGGGGFSRARWFGCAVGMALLWLVLPTSEVLLEKKFYEEESEQIENTFASPNMKVALCHSKIWTEPQVQHVVVAQDKRGVF